MFTAMGISGNRVSALDEADDERLAILRDQGRAGALRCQHCDEPVILRAGKVIRRHFSHAPGAQCPFAHEPANRLEARAALYRWLKYQFGERAATEKMPGNDLPVPHPIDGWVETSDGRTLAYFVVDRRLDAETRAYMRGLYEQAGIILHWVFLTRWIRRPEGSASHKLKLTGTERDCLSISEYNVPHGSPNGACYRSLHYLDARTQQLTTFRAMRSFDCRNGYRGTEITSPLSSVTAEAATGEFVHMGEPERLLEFHEAQRQAEIERQQHRELLRRRADEDAREWERLRVERASASHGTSEVPVESTAPNVQRVGSGWEATCIFCAAYTRKWYRSSPGSGRCVCLVCRRAGVDDGRSI